MKAFDTYTCHKKTKRRKNPSLHIASQNVIVETKIGKINHQNPTIAR